MLYTTKLDLIANGEINNQGICWAATGASIINYKRGGTVKCNARKVYYDLKKNTMRIQLEIFSGKRECGSIMQYL